MPIDKKFIDQFIKVTSNAALSASYLVGKNDKNAADQAAVDSMRSELNKIAMTGEIDLNGSIRQIGGLQSKLEGAKSAGVELVIIPKNNEDDLNKLPDEIKKCENFEVVIVNNIFEALKHALVDNDLKFNE